MVKEYPISAETPDWSREKRQRYWDPSRQLISSIRDYQSAKGPFKSVLKRFCVLRHRFWSVVTGADIPLNARIGGGLLMPHPNGIVIHPSSSVGCNCLLFQQVTITGGVVIGGHVDIGAGAKVLGPANIGDHTRIGANAVVKGDVASGSTVVGIPAKPI